MDEDFFLEDVDDDIDDEEDLSLGATDEDLNLTVTDEDFTVTDEDSALVDSGEIMRKMNLPSDEDILVSNKDSKPTQRMTRMSMKVFFQFLWLQGIEINLETCTKQELALAMKQFFLKVKKSNGGMYKKNAFGSIKFGLVRGIKEIRKDIDFSSDKEFTVAMQAFKQTMGKLRFLGKTVDHIEKITSEDLEKLYKSDTFNTRRPTSLQYKVFFEIIFYLTCSRGRRNLRNLMPSHVAIKHNKNGRKYIQIVHQPKFATYLGGSEASGTHNGPKGGLIFEMPGDPKCPVAAIELYLSRLPPLCNFLFPQPADRHKTGNFLETDVWYLNSALGKNSLGAMMKEISKQADLSRSYSNFCIHATSASILNRKGYDVKNYLEKLELFGSKNSGNRPVGSDEVLMLEKISDVLTAEIIPKGPQEGVQNSDCNMYIVPIQSTPAIVGSKNRTILPAPQLNLTAQNPQSGIIVQSIRPLPAVQSTTRTAVRIQPFSSRSLLHQNVRPIAPKVTNVSSILKPVQVPQVTIKKEPTSHGSIDYTPQTWTVTHSPVVTPVSSQATQQGLVTAVPTSASHIIAGKRILFDTSYQPMSSHGEDQTPQISMGDQVIPMETDPYVISLKSDLQKKEEMLQETRKKVGQLELYQGEYKRLLHESTILQQHLTTSQDKNKELSTKIDSMKKTKPPVHESSDNSFERICCNTSLFKHYTGYNPEEFQMLFQFLLPVNSSGPYKGKGHSLSLRSQLLLTLYKLRNNFTFVDLGYRFNIATVTAKNIFLAWLNLMAEKFEEVYVWPHRETLKAQLPRHFQQDFPNTFALFKRVKIHISVKQSQKLDDVPEKNTNVLKNLHGILAVSPRGCVIGCSGLVTGKLTDIELFRKSGLKNELQKFIESGRLQEGDGILSEQLDIGTDLGEIGLKLNNVAFSKCDIDDDLKSLLQKQRVQTHKVMIDKAFFRWKKFKIVSQVIPHSLSTSSDKIFQVTAFLTNFQPPLSLDVN